MSTLVKNNGTSLPTVPQFFDDFLTRDLFNWSNFNKSYSNSLPAVNIKEFADKFELEVAAPGLNKKDFNVELNNDQLIISTKLENFSEENSEDENFTRKEFNFQSFKRTFNLPERAVEGDKITAKYSNGILNISIPKTEEAKEKPPRQITIK